MIYFVGILAGLISGFFGAGGGLILVPALVRILKVDEYVARGTTLISILSMVITSGIFYYKNNYFDFQIIIYSVIGGIVGGFLGAKLMKKIPKFYLSLIFDIFLIGVSLKIILQ